MAGAFLKHASGDVVLVHTAAEIQEYQRNGYVVCTWDDWFDAKYRVVVPETSTEADALRREGEVE